MFPYHSRLKKLLKTETYYVIEEKSPFAYRFIFPEINKSIPIRPHRVYQYRDYLKEVSENV